MRSESSFSSSSIFYSKVVKEFFVAFLRLFISDFFDLLDLLDLLVLDFLSSWFYRESHWNFSGNGVLGALPCHSCSTYFISRDPCCSVHIYSCCCRPFEKMTILMMWVGSPLDSWWTCTRDGGSSEVSWSCGHHLL